MSLNQNLQNILSELELREFIEFALHSAQSFNSENPGSDKNLINPKNLLKSRFR